MNEKSTEEREEDEKNESNHERDERDDGGLGEEAAEGQQDEPRLEDELARADDVIIIEVLIVEFWFLVPVAGLAEEQEEEYEIICYLTLSLDIISIFNLATLELYPLFSDADGRCRWH
jgi:hypothetical protein